MKRMPDWLAAPVRFIRRIALFRVPLYAANASFYLVLSVFPAILLVLALLPHTGLTEAHLLSALHGVIPSVFEPALEWVIRDLGSNSSLTLIPVSAIMAIWSSSRGVYCIKTGLNAIYGERESRGYVYTRLVSVLYTVLLLAALLLTLVLHVFGSQLTAWIAGKHVPILRLLSRVLRFRGLVLFALLTLLFWAILCVFPNRRIPLLRALPGAAGARSAGWCFHRCSPSMCSTSAPTPCFTAALPALPWPCCGFMCACPFCSMAACSIACCSSEDHSKGNRKYIVLI